MPGKNKTPLLGWHPPAELSAWVREAAADRGVTVSSMLTEALQMLREALEATDALDSPYSPPEASPAGGGRCGGRRGG